MYTSPSFFKSLTEFKELFGSLTEHRDQSDTQNEMKKRKPQLGAASVTTLSLKSGRR
uniref:Uncharacterized protein n=1 Tax=Helianthus annuus TaxID=4232 RepID=A0A251SZ26_HELAN